jgi:hypothetical protein
MVNGSENLITINVQVSNLNGKPCLELRKRFTDPEQVKSIVSCAWHDQGLMFLPVFNDKVNALGSLIQNGILYKSKDGQYKFTL